MKSEHYPTMSRKIRRDIRQKYQVYQKGECYYCGENFYNPPTFPHLRIKWDLFPGGEEGFLRYPIHLHHNHKTGMTIGAVHSICNAVLWQVHGE